jgi:hypothetical protein
MKDNPISSEKRKEYNKKYMYWSQIIMDNTKKK